MVQYIAKVVVLVSGPVKYVPLVPMFWYQPPPGAHFVAFVEFHETTLAPPLTTVDGVALMLIVIGGMTGTGFGVG